MTSHFQLGPRGTKPSLDSSFHWHCQVGSTYHFIWSSSYLYLLIFLSGNLAGFSRHLLVLIFRISCLVLVHRIRFLVWSIRAFGHSSSSGLLRASRLWRHWVLGEEEVLIWCFYRVNMVFVWVYDRALMSWHYKKWRVLQKQIHVVQDMSNSWVVINCIMARLINS